MNVQSAIRAGFVGVTLGAISILGGCATAPMEAAKYKPKCSGPSSPVVLEIILDGGGNPVEVQNAGQNADILVVCPDTKVSWDLPGTTSFKIKFTRSAPFHWSSNEKASQAVGNKHQVADQVKHDAKYDGYKYIVRIKGKVDLDPIIVIDR